jgi:IMP cyclohydrolase
MTSIHDALQRNRYPGRLLLLARTLDEALVAGYALTGRSTASRERRLERTGAGELAVLPTGAQQHDALRHYIAATSSDRWTVYGNGEQVGEVARRLEGGLAPAAALMDLVYEPDPPIFTPRITAVIDRRDGRAWLGSAYRPAAFREEADVAVVGAGTLARGDVLLLSTYDSDGHDVKTTAHHRDLTTTAPDAEAMLDELWTSLNPRYAIAATVFTPLDGTNGPIRHA